MKQVMIFLALVGMVSITSRSQMITMKATHLSTASGVPIADGVASFTPNLCNGVATNFQAPGLGLVSSASIPATVSKGVLSSPQLVDALIANPHICYSFTVRDRVSNKLLFGQGYDKIQPSATASWCSSVNGAVTCDLGLLPPNVVAMVPITSGPQGQPGQQGLPGAQGNPGQSAYQLALANGFVGSQAAWLSSLQGPAGASAYQLALSNGFVGSQSAWIASLRGPQGIAGTPGTQGIPGTNGTPGTPGTQGTQGIQGIQGNPGTPGQNGIPGTPGTPGTNGLNGSNGVNGTNGSSAYQLAVAGGFVGSQSAWLSSLQGSAGNSAYQVAVTNGFSGTQAQWLASLQGQQGVQGIQGTPGSSVSDGSSPATTTNSIVATDSFTGEVITVGPAYGYTDNSHLVPSNDGSVIHDSRTGFEGDRYLNCRYQFGVGADFQSNACKWNLSRSTTQPNTPNNSQPLARNALESWGKSTNYTSYWRLSYLFDESVKISNRGIAGVRQVTFYKSAIGDVNLDDMYANVYCGWKTPADEGCVGRRLYFFQPLAYYQGTSQSSGTGLTAPLLSNSYTAGNTTIDGGYLLNTSKGNWSGTVTGPGSLLAASGYLFQYPVTTMTGTLPVNTGWAYCPTTIPLPPQPQVSTSVTLSCQIKMGAFTTGGNVWVAGPTYPEQDPITAVGPVSNGIQSITITARHPQPVSGINLIQGPSVGQYISLDSVLSKTNQRTTHFNFGSMDGTNLIIGYWSTGASLPLLTCGASPFCPGVAGQNSIHSYPGSEIIANHSLTHDPELEVGNNIPFAVGDTIESPAPDAMTMSAYKTACGQQTLTNGGLSNCFDMSISGTGVNNNFAMFNVHNDADYNMYIQNGGWAFGPTLFHIGGYFDYGHVFDLWPGQGVGRISNLGSVSSTNARFWDFPSDTLYWEDANRMLRITGLSSAFYRGPLNTFTGSCSTAQSGYTAISMDGHIVWCIVPNGATSGTWTERYMPTSGGLFGGPTNGQIAPVAGTGAEPVLVPNSAGFGAPAPGGTPYLYKLAATATLGILHAAAPSLDNGVNKSVLTSSPIDLTSSDVTGVLPVANGGVPTGGLTISGSSCVITAITNGIITGAHCP